MQDVTMWQLHANGSQDGRDLALRVTITGYDDAGFEVATQTFRRHVTGLQFEQLRVQAAAITLELYKLMDHHLTSGEIPSELDEPLF